MLPAQRNKVDVSKLTAAEQQAFRLYGKLPSRPVAKSQERKYFDSGDWALSKAGKQKGEYGKEIPTPDGIPHASPSPQVSATSPGSSTPGLSGSPGGSGSLGGLMSPPTGSSIGLAGSAAAGGAGSPPGSFVIGNTGGTSPTGSSGLGQSNTLASGSSESTAPGAVPISGQSSTLMNDPVSLSMSPGRVGIGGQMGGPPSIHSMHSLATSPTRSTGSFPIAHNHNSSVHHHSYSTTSTSPTSSSSVGVGISIGGGSNNVLSPSGSGNHTSGSSALGLSGGAGGHQLLSGTSPMISATTGNQIGKTQIRRTSQSDGSGSSSSSSANSASANAQNAMLPAAVNASSNMGGSSTLDMAMSPPPRSGLANSITPESLMDDDDDDEDNEEEDEEKVATPGARGEDEQVEGMELQ